MTRTCCECNSVLDSTGQIIAHMELTGHVDYKLDPPIRFDPMDTVQPILATHAARETQEEFQGDSVELTDTEIVTILTNISDEDEDPGEESDDEESDLEDEDSDEDDEELEDEDLEEDEDEDGDEDEEFEDLEVGETVDP